MKFSISSSVPNSAKALIWDVFFTSRNRGIDFYTHFPWIENSEEINCLTFSESSSGLVVATLVMRKKNLPKQTRYAMVGMVCVHERWRGQGLSTMLLTSMLTFAAEQKINSLLLWTGLPEIYGKQGFVPDGCDSFSQVTLDPLRQYSQVRFIRNHSDIASGLPPFAKQLISFESDAARLTCVETAQGLALAKWQGPMHAVLDLIEVALPTSWGLNSPADAPIFCELRKRGHLYTPLPTAKRMVRHLGVTVHIPYISIIDRI